MVRQRGGILLLPFRYPLLARSLAYPNHVVVLTSRPRESGAGLRHHVSTVFLSQKWATLRAFPRYFFLENTKLTPPFT